MAKLSIPSIYLKKAASVAGATVAAALLLAYTADLWAQRKLPFIETSLSEQLGRPVTVESAHFGLFRGFTLNGVELRQRAPLAGIRVRRLSALPSFSLFPPTIAVRRVIIEDAEITLYELPRKGFDAQALIQGLSTE